MCWFSNRGPPIVGSLWENLETPAKLGSNSLGNPPLYEQHSLWEAVSVYHRSSHSPQPCFSETPTYPGRINPGNEKGGVLMAHSLVYPCGPRTSVHECPRLQEALKIKGANEKPGFEPVA